MIILYNFDNQHFALACTGLKDCSFVFGFNSTHAGAPKHQGADNSFTLPRIIHPYLDLNHYNLGHSAPQRVGIPSVEDGNPYGPSECAIYQWLFFGEKSYATVIPVGPASLLDSIWHAPTRVARALSSRPIDQWYLPMGLGMLPVPFIVDSAHCLDMIRWMLRVAFWNRDHPENLEALGLPVPPVRANASERTPLNRPRNSMKANHLMRLSYWLASGPGFNTLTAPLLFMTSAKKLRDNVIDANLAAGYEHKEGMVIEASGAGTYARYFGRTFTNDTTFQGGLLPRTELMSPVYKWEVYQSWMNNFVILDSETQTPGHPVQYRRINLLQTPSRLKDYFCPSATTHRGEHATYPDAFKYALDSGAPDGQGQFYGRSFNPHAQPVQNWTSFIERGKDFAVKGWITNEIEKRYETLRDQIRTLQTDLAIPVELEKTETFYSKLLRIKHGAPIHLHNKPIAVQAPVGEYVLSLLHQHYTVDSEPARVRVAHQLSAEMMSRSEYLNLNAPNSGRLLDWLNKRAHILIVESLRS